MNRPLPVCLFLLWLAVPIAATAQADLQGNGPTISSNLGGGQYNLPEIAEPSDNVLSPRQEEMLGRELMRQIRVALPLVADIEIREYLQELGYSLGTHARGRYRNSFNFFLINSQQINAFAMPGGFVGVNVGLILAMETEAQLAGVLAHELAHLTQRHHARAFALADKNRLSTAATIIAALLIGAANPQAGQATLAAGLAISQQNSINYTRNNEYEADRIGINTLADSGYDPGALAETFEIMQSRNSINNSGSQLEYLRTHPLDSNRIAEARSRAAQMKARPSNHDELNFQLFQTRLQIVSEQADHKLLPSFEKRHAQKPNAQTHYALALLATRAGSYQQARNYLKPLVNQEPDNRFIQLLYAQIALENNEQRTSEKVLSQLVAIYPDSYAAVAKLVELKTRQSHLQQAADIIRQYQRRSQRPDPQSWRDMAGIQEKNDDLAGSHESLAQYFLEMDEVRKAIDQLQLALTLVPKGTQDEMRLSALLKALKSD